MGLPAGTPAASLKYPMSLAGEMSALAERRPVPAVEPAGSDACPVLLTQPAEDRRRPHRLSLPVLSRSTMVPVGTGTLDNAGHYPVEDPCLRQMRDTIAAFVTKYAT